MHEIRLPVSLKVDTDSDFYKDFLLDLKESRLLSTFIMDMLQSYYENDEIKVRVDMLIEDNTAFSEIKKQLGRIRLEHSKNMMTSSILADHTNRSLQDITSELSKDDASTESNTTPEERTSAEQVLLPLNRGSTLEANSASIVNPSDKTVSDNDIVTRLESIEKLIPSIDDKLSILMNAVLNGVTKEKGSDSTHRTEIVSATEKTNEVHQNNKASVTDNVLVVELHSDPKQQENLVVIQHESPSVQQEHSSVPFVLVADEKSSDPPLEVRPASFKKAFGSIKKSSQ